MPSDDVIQSLVGKVLDGRYRIDQLIGAGGMGAVFRAEHLGTGRSVAVKTILPSLVENQDALERFRREARALGAMRHPNIVDVTDFGVARVGASDVAYLVMEYLEGHTLASLLKEAGKLQADVVLDLVEQVALALDSAHGAGIIHRDLKPDNIWLVPDARGGAVVRVLDFGIAKLREPTPPGEDTRSLPAFTPYPARNDDTGLSTGEAAVRVSEIDGKLETRVPSPNLGETEETAIQTIRWPATGAGLTAVGSTIGTPAYMSPEQCLGGNVGPRSDLYSLGVVAWQALVGRPMFRGNSLELVHKHCNELPPRVDEENPDLPRPFGLALARALEKDPERRYPSARAMAGSLRVAIEGPGTILRRAAMLYLDHWESFLRISWRGATPAILLVVPAGLAAWTIWMMGSSTIASLFASFAGAILWSLATVVTHSVFAAVVDQLRTRPLEALDVGRIYARLNRRLGLREEAGIIRLLPRLMSFYTRCELRGPAGQGDLAFQIAFHEELAPGEVGDRCAILSSSTKKAYDRIRLVILGSVIAIPLVEIALIFSIGNLAGLHKPDVFVLAPAAAMLSLPVSAAFLNPILSSALALLYFRPRQANGEDVALSAVTASRL